MASSPMTNFVIRANVILINSSEIPKLAASKELSAVKLRNDII